MPPRRIEPKPGQESVWDYPRPPAVVPFIGRVRVVHGGRTVADTVAAVRVLETSQPPAFYFPVGDVDTTRLRASPTSTWCEWKGSARYWHLDHLADAAWSYPHPTSPFVAITDHLAFYAQKVDECWVDDERVLPNPGHFYGGWITTSVVGPFKGGAGSSNW
ncbi:MAG: DUF427 domain-containing protein [Ilumatobacteraceae bacterium]